MKLQVDLETFSEQRSKTIGRTVEFLSLQCPNNIFDLEPLIKVLFADRYTWQNFCLRLLRLVNRLYAVSHKMEKSMMKVLPYVTVSE